MGTGLLCWVGGPLCLCHPQRAFLASPLGGPGRSEAHVSAAALPAWEPLVGVLVGVRKPLLHVTQPQLLSAQLSALIWASCPRLQLGPSWRGSTETPDSRWWARHPLGGQRPGSHHCDLFSKISQKRVVLSPYSSSLTPSWPQLLDCTVLPNT